MKRLQSENVHVWKRRRERMARLLDIRNDLWMAVLVGDGLEDGFVGESSGLFLDVVGVWKVRGSRDRAKE
jgi:hypothetical protein